MKRSKPVQTKAWEKTKIQNLVRHKSGRYYARIYAGGKETWKALKTDLLEVAKAKLRAVAPALEGRTRAAAAQDRGRMPLGDGATILRERLKTGTSMPGRGKTIRRVGARVALQSAGVDPEHGIPVQRWRQDRPGHHR